MGPLPQQQKYIKQITDISDEEGLKRAYETRDGLYQHYNELFIAGTKDFPVDHIHDLKLTFDGTLNKTTRGRTADAYYRSHNEIDSYRALIRCSGKFGFRKTILKNNMENHME